jgi:hypothetical protein
MSQIDRITDPDFLPNAQDILQIRQVLNVADIDRITDPDFLPNAQDILQIRQVLHVADIDRITDPDFLPKYCMSPTGSITGPDC